MPIGFTVVVRNGDRHPLMVKILERAETAGELPTRRTAVGKRHASNMDPVTLCYFRFGNAFTGMVRSDGNHDWISSRSSFLTIRETLVS